MVNTYRVVSSESGWSLVRDQGGIALWESPEKDAVVEFAHRVARANAPSRVVVHGEEGGIESETDIDAEETPRR